MYFFLRQEAYVFMCKTEYKWMCLFSSKGLKHIYEYFILLTTSFFARKNYICPKAIILSKLSLDTFAIC